MKKKITTAIQRFAQKGGKSRWNGKTEEEKFKHMSEMGKKSQKIRKEKKKVIPTLK